MGEPVGIAIVGCGWAGARHAQAWEKTGAEIRWAVDLDMARANSLKESLPGGSKVRAAMDYRHPLADPDVDAVDICLPHNLHAPVTVEATAAGKHVLCEKPMAGTLKEADRMIEAAGRAESS